MGIKTKISKALAFGIISALTILVQPIVAFAITAPATCDTVNLPTNWLTLAKAEMTSKGWTYDWTDASTGGFIYKASGNNNVRFQFGENGIQYQVADAGSNVTRIYDKNVTGSNKYDYLIIFDPTSYSVVTSSRVSHAANQEFSVDIGTTTPGGVSGNPCFKSIKNAVYGRTAYSPVLNAVFPQSSDSTGWNGTTFYTPPAEPTVTTINDPKNCVDNVCQFKDVSPDATQRDIKIMSGVIAAFVAYQIIMLFRWRSHD